MSKLAVCVPTYQNADDIQSLIINEMPLYEKMGIDLYIMDSSWDDSTERVVRREKNSYTGLFYYRFDSDIPSNTKVFKVFQMAGHEIPCDYIWVRADILCAHKILLEHLKHILDVDRYDFLVLNPQGRYPDDVLEINDKQEVFEKYTWILTMYGAAILNVKRMLDLADWTYLTDRYLGDECINYSHVCLFFELLNLIEKAHILILNNGVFFKYMHPKIATWEHITFPITLIVWPNAINRLPDTYKNKMKVIHSLLDGGFYGFWFLEHLAEEGILTPELVDDYREQIEKYTNTSIDDVYAIARGEHLYQPPTGVSDYELLLAFAKKYEKLVIYGCGKRGQRYARCLLDNGIGFDAFLVTDISENIPKVLNHRVLQADQYIFEENTGIILGMGIDNQMEVYDYLIEKYLLGQTFAYPVTGADLQRFLDKLSSISKDGIEYDARNT